MANPNPDRVTAAMWWFWGQLQAMEPTSLLGGIHEPPKLGYHGTRLYNLSHDADNYSIRDGPDKLGPDDKAAALDWTMPEAQGSTPDYRRMVKYGKRLLAAFNARDRRLAGWREALGQTDDDGTAEGLDFRHWTTRTPDDRHLWHWHFSECRAYVEDLDNKKAFLSILRGETLEQYLAVGGRLLGEMELTEFVQALRNKNSPLHSAMRAIAWQYDGGGLPPGTNNTLQVLSQIHAAVTGRLPDLVAAAIREASNDPALPQVPIMTETQIAALSAHIVAALQQSNGENAGDAADNPDT